MAKNKTSETDETTATPVFRPETWDGTVERRLTIEEKYRKRFDPYVHKPKSKPKERPFDIDDCLQRFKVFVDAGWRADPKVLKLGPEMSPAEGRLWLELFTNPELVKSRKELQIETVKETLDEALPPWSDFMEKRLLRGSIPEFLGVPIAKVFPPTDLIETELPKAVPYGFSLVLSLFFGLERVVIPFLSWEEWTAFKTVLERAFKTSQFPRNPYNTPPVCFLLARKLEMAQFLKPVVEDWPDLPRRPYSYWSPAPENYLEDTVFALGERDLAIRHFRRMNLKTNSPDLIRRWILVTGLDALDVITTTILDESDKLKAARLIQTFGESAVAPEVGREMIRLLAESKAPSEAREWLEAHPVKTIAGAVPLVNEPGKVGEAATRILRSLHWRGFTAIIAHFSSQHPGEISDRIGQILTDEAPGSGKAFTDETTPDWLRSAFAETGPIPSNLPAWCIPTDLPPLKWGEYQLNEDQMLRLLGVLQSVKTATLMEVRLHPLIAAIRTHLAPEVRDDFLWGLFEAWGDAGMVAADGWAFLAFGLLGTDRTALKLTPMIRKWPGESQHFRSVIGLEILRAIGSDIALMQISGIAEKISFKALKTKAQECLEAIAKDRNLSRTDLEDRIIPDCDLDERGGRTFDFGPRQFRMILGNDLKPRIREEDGKLKTDLPKPNSKDDPTLSAQAVTEWKLLKKQVSEVAAIQAGRLEQAMVTGRRWRAETFELLFVRHPLMINFAQKLLWATFDDNGRMTATFRVSEDLSLSTVEDRPFSLSADAMVGVVHPLQMSESERAEWGQLFGDYEIIPPFPQLGRPIFGLNPAEKGTTQILRFNTTKIPGKAIVFPLEKSGWVRGMPEDGGFFYSHSKAFPAANVTAVVKYQGLPIGWMEGWTDQSLEWCAFISGTHHKWAYPTSNTSLTLDTIDPVVISEVLADLTFVASKGK